MVVQMVIRKTIDNVKVMEFVEPIALEEMKTQISIDASFGVLHLMVILVKVISNV